MQYIHAILCLIIIWHIRSVKSRASPGFYEEPRDSLDDFVDYLNKDNLLSKSNSKTIDGDLMTNYDIIHHNARSSFEDLPPNSFAKQSSRFQRKPISGITEREIYSPTLNIKSSPIEINTLTRDSLILKIGGKEITILAKPRKHIGILESDTGYEVSRNQQFNQPIEAMSEETDLPDIHHVGVELINAPESSSFEVGHEITSEEIHHDKVHYISEFGHPVNDSEDLSRFKNSDINEEIENEYFFSNKDETENFESDEIVNRIPSLEISSEQDTSHDVASDLDAPESKEADVIDEEITEMQENKNSRNLNMAFEGSGDMEDFIGDIDLKNKPTEDKSGRFFDVFSRFSETSSVCTTPNGEPGHCRRFRDCILSEALNGFNLFLQYMCLIRGALVGICCPDNPVIEISNPDLDNSTAIDIKEDIKQPPEGCGLNTKTRIVGGKVSLPHEWTWMVALLRRNRFYCGGVIINNWYILTAAHCVLGVNVRDLTVRLGEYNFNTKNEHQEDISVSEIKRHAQFVTLTFEHDIALLKLKRRIQYTKFVGSICLPTNNTARDFSDTNGTVVGWGTVSFGGAASPVLREVTIPVWTNEECDKTYVLENINESFLCAGSPENGEDACQGDSGGPLMALNNRGRWEVIGIVSWGRRCGDPVYPGVYTRVTTYLDWIKENSQ